jgi:hypothetical protein
MVDWDAWMEMWMGNLWLFDSCIYGLSNLGFDNEEQINQESKADHE